LSSSKHHLFFKPGYGWGGHVFGEPYSQGLIVSGLRESTCRERLRDDCYRIEYIDQGISLDYEEDWGYRLSSISFEKFFSIEGGPNAIGESLDVWVTELDLSILDYKIEKLMGIQGEMLSVDIESLGITLTVRSGIIVTVDAFTE